jgi:hypothetical protein
MKDEWWLDDSNPDAKEHRMFLQQHDKKGRSLTAPIQRRNSIANPGYVTAGTYAKDNGDLKKLLTESFNAVKREVTALRDRIAELENRPSLEYAGVWEATKTYGRNDAVSWAGSIWIARRDDNLKKPGLVGSGWQLAVKRGRDGKDAK